MAIKDLDRRLIDLLRDDARQSTTALARRLGVARSTVQDHLDRLLETGVIRGFSVRLADPAERRLITAHVMIGVDPKKSDNALTALKKMPEIRALYAVSGVYDLIAILRAETTERIDARLDDIGRLDGVEKTHSSIVLSTKLDR